MLPCHSFDIVNNSAGRVLFDACVYYTLTIFVVVRWWHKPVLAPRNTKYFIIGAVFVWLLAIVAVVYPHLCRKNSLTFVDTVVMLRRVLILFSYLIFLHPISSIYSAIPFIFILVLLIKLCFCYINGNTIGEHRDSKKALLKFGFFFLIIQGVNAMHCTDCFTTSGADRNY